MQNIPSGIPDYRSSPFLSTPKGQLQRNMKIKDKNCFFTPSWETDAL